MFSGRLFKRALSSLVLPWFVVARRRPSSVNLYLEDAIEVEETPFEFLLLILGRRKRKINRVDIPLFFMRNFLKLDAFMEGQFFDVEQNIPGIFCFEVIVVKRTFQVL